MYPFKRGPGMPNVRKYFLYISYCTLTKDEKVKGNTSKLRLLRS